jgi:hypothetical protein
VNSPSASRARNQEAGGRRQAAEECIFHFSFQISHFSFRTEEDQQWKMRNEKFEMRNGKSKYVLLRLPPAPAACLLLPASCRLHFVVFDNINI